MQDKNNTTGFCKITPKSALFVDCSGKAKIKTIFRKKIGGAFILNKPCDGCQGVDFCSPNYKIYL